MNGKKQIGFEIRWTITFSSVNVQISSLLPLCSRYYAMLEMSMWGVCDCGSHDNKNLRLLFTNSVFLHPNSIKFLLIKKHCALY